MKSKRIKSIFTYSNDGKCAAFTLAEVLITLVIIGVIAALTIPNLMQSYKKHEVEVKLKEAYSILENAVKVSETENGPTSEWEFHWNTDKITDIAENKLVPYLKVVKNCKSEKNSTCFNDVKDLDGESVNIVYKFILANGMSMGVNIPWSSHAIVYVDIDGPLKGKSELGRDIFIFSIINRQAYSNSSWPVLTVSPGAVSASTGGNYYIIKNTDELINSAPGACSPGHNIYSLVSGSQCAAAIAKNSWKIPDDYPVKKW